MMECFPKIWRKISTRSGARVRYYFFGIKIASFKRKINFIKIYRRFRKVERKIKNKAKINVAFLVTLPSMFPARPVMERMIKSAKYNVSIMLIPDFRFGIERAKEIQEKGYKELNDFQEHIRIVPISRVGFYNIERYADIVFPSTPYDISHPEFDLLNIAESGILPAMVNYGFFRSYYDRKLISDRRYALYWKVFAETKYNEEEYKRHSVLKGENVVLTGYCKMDGYKNRERRTRRKKIMIAPHHSLEGGFNDILSLSNFDRYANLFLELPDRYPNLDFIFRPHPALFIFLSRQEYWGNEKVNSYIHMMKSKKNVVYSDGGDYFKEFADSDALIDDCGSFLVEYFYTGKPQCYLLKGESDIQYKFTKLGKKCLANCYLAYSDSQIIEFIEEVVIGGCDKKSIERLEFAKEIMLNYPYASDVALDHLDRIFDRR